MHLSVLGPVELTTEKGRTIDLSPGALSLLCILASRGGGRVTQDQLIDLLWEDDLPGNPRGALQTTVSRLRAALDRDEAPLIETGSGTYRLVTDRLTLDSAEFEEMLARSRSAAPAEAASLLRRALALWRGDAYADVPLDALRAERVRLEELRFVALENRIAADLGLGRHADLVAELSALTSRHPYRESLWGHLMVALYGMGRQAEALGTYRRARERLIEDLGIEPGPGLRRVEEAILLQDPALATAPIGPVAGGRLALPRPWTNFIGRTAELEEVTRLLRSSRVVTITGPGGIGKTRLAVEVARAESDRFMDGAHLLALEQQDRDETLEAVIDRALADGVGPTGAIERLIGLLRGRDALVVIDGSGEGSNGVELVTEILRQCPDVKVLVTSPLPLGLIGEKVIPLGPLAVASEHGWEGEAAQLFVDRAGLRRPLSELDETTGRLIAQIVRRLDGSPLAIELAALRTDLSLEGLAAKIDQEILDTTTDPSMPVRYRSLAAAVDGTLRSLSADALATAKALAFMQSPWDLTIASHLLTPEYDRAQIEAILTELQGRSLVVEAGTVGGEPSHRLLNLARARVQSSLQDRDGDPYRSRHAQAILAVFGGGDLTRYRSAQGRDLLARANRSHADITAAARWLLEHDPERAAELVSGLYGYWTATDRTEEAEELARRALEATEGTTHARAVLLVLLGWATRPGGDMAELGNVRFTHPFHRLRAPVRRTAESRARGRESVEALRCAVDMFAELGADDHRLAATGVLGQSLGAVGAAAAGLELIEGILAKRPAVTDDGDLPMPLPCSVVFDRANLSLAVGDVEAARTIADEAMDMGCAERDLEVSVMILDLRARIAKAQGEFPRANALYERALLEHAAPAGHPGQALLHAELGFGCTRSGKPAEALGHFGRALRTGREHGLPRIEPWIRVGLGVAEMLNDRPDHARTSIETALVRYTELSDEEGMALALALLGIVHEKAGRLEEAIGFHRRCLAVDFADDVPLVMALNGFAGRAARNGMPAEAARLLGAADSAVTRSATFRVPWMPGRATERAVAAALDPDTLQREMAVGAAWTRREAIEAAHATA